LFAAVPCGSWLPFFGPADSPAPSTLTRFGTGLPGNSFPLRDDLSEHFVEYHYR
jgi:hypothetical protein